MDLNFNGTDVCAINGTRSAPEARYDLVVVGAGPSGIAAAIEGAKAGQSVLLVDENPVSGGLMGNDTPLYFGGRMTAATQNSERMLEAIFMSMPALEDAMEAGVELLLGTTAWGVYRNGPGVQSLPDQVVGLADSERSWMVGFTKIVLATGARDLAIAFPGWNQPGVMGAAALTMLLTRYDAFAGRRLLILGSHDLALETALPALDAPAPAAAAGPLPARQKIAWSITNNTAIGRVASAILVRIVDARSKADRPGDSKGAWRPGTDD